MPTITSISARPILDSRADWTIEVAIELASGCRGRASVPQGKSTGMHEVVSMRADTAVDAAAHILNPEIEGQSFDGLAAFDERLSEIDGTENRSHVGGNVMLGASCAYARAAAAERGVSFHEYLSETYTHTHTEARKVPVLYMNMINGGAHAPNGLPIQEYLVAVQTQSVFNSVDIGAQIYNALREYVAKKIGGHAATVGDEGGFAPDMVDVIEPLTMLSHVAKELGVDDRVQYGIDAAANNIDESDETKSEWYDQMIEKFAMSYIEDPFNEEDFDAFAAFRERVPESVHVVGDDLTTTNSALAERAKRLGSINAIIIKPNQIGTLSDAMKTTRIAQEAGWHVVVSHRSGETSDDWIADFAYAVHADGVKFGAPARGERTAKYNRLLAIYQTQHSQSDL